MCDFSPRNLICGWEIKGLGLHRRKYRGVDGVGYCPWGEKEPSVCQLVRQCVHKGLSSIPTTLRPLQILHYTNNGIPSVDNISFLITIPTLHILNMTKKCEMCRVFSFLIMHILCLTFA